MSQSEDYRQMCLVDSSSDMGHHTGCNMEDTFHTFRSSPFHRTYLLQYMRL